MKRLIGYLSITGALLTGVLVGVVPTLLSVNGNSDFSSSNRFVFKISDKRLSADFSEGTLTNGGNLTYNESDGTALEQVTDVIKERLSLAEVSSYQLESYADNMFALTFKDSNQNYEDIISYLTFSNSLMFKNADEEYNLGYSAEDVYNNNTTAENNQLFEEGSATVQYRDNYPYVVVKLANPDNFKTMFDGIKEASEGEEGSDADTDAGSDIDTDTSTGEDTGGDTTGGDSDTGGDTSGGESGGTVDSGTSEAHHFKQISRAEDLSTTTDTSTDSTTTGDGETEEVEKVDPNKAIFVVNNWLNGLNLQGLLDNENGNITNENFSDYVLTYFNVENPSSFIWDYDSSLSEEEQEAKTYEYIYFSNYNLGAINGDGALDVTTSYQTYNAIESDEGLAYKKANLLADKLNASDYKFDVTLINQSQIDNNENLVSPFVEYIKRAGHVEISTVLICTIIAVVIVSLFTLLNYGLSGLLPLVVTGANVTGSLALFNFLGNEFNIGTIIGLFAVAALSLIGCTIWLHRAKEDIYLGRNLKKSYQDANKKTLLNLLDFTVIGAVVGLCAYLIPNSFTTSFGGVFIIGTVISVITVGIIFRAVSWLLYNSQFAQNHLKLFGIEKKMVPDLSKGEKPTYFDAYNKRSSKTTFKVTGIIAAVLLVASIVGITTFQVMNGNIYNTASSEVNSKLVLRYDLSNASDNYNVDTQEINIQKALGEIYFDEQGQEQVFDSEMDVNSFYYEYVYGDTNPITNREYYFVVDLGSALDVLNTSNTNYYVRNDDGSTFTVANGISAAITTSIENYVGSNYAATTEVNASYNYTDDLVNMYVAISTAISTAIILFYFLFRFGPSKALTALTVGATTLVSVIGIFSLVRGPFSSEITLGLLLVSFIAYIILDLFFTNERLAYLENKHDLKELSSREEKYDYVGNSLYNYIVINMMLVAFIVLSFFFTPAFDKNTLLLILVGMFLLVIFIKALELPIQMFYARHFEKLGKRMAENRQTRSNNKKSNTPVYDDGPQEAIFIDIND